MGKEISYCHSCGHRLLVNESEQNRAVMHENRRFCRTCCPSQPIAAPPVAQRRQSSTRLRMQGPPAPRLRETTRIRRRNPVTLVASAAAVVALGLGIAIAAGSSSPAPVPPGPVVAPVGAAPPAPKQPPAAPAPTIDELLVQAREIRQSDLMFDRRDDVVRLLKEAAGRAGPRLEEIDLLTADYDRKFEQAAARLADFTRSEAMRMAAKRKYAEAIERLDGYPAAFRGSKAAETLRLVRQDLERRRAESALPLSPAPPKRIVAGASRQAL